MRKSKDPIPHTAPGGSTAGQTEEPRALVLLPADTSQPETVAKRFLAHRSASVREEIAGDVILNQGIAAFIDNPEKRTRLLEALVEAKVISRAEADAGLKKSTNKSLMSMLRKIAQYSDVILDSRILPFLQPGYSVLYHVALLFEALEKTHDRP